VMPVAGLSTWPLGLSVERPRGGVAAAVAVDVTGSTRHLEPEVLYCKQPPAVGLKPVAAERLIYNADFFATEQTRRASSVQPALAAVLRFGIACSLPDSCMLLQLSKLNRAISRSTVARSRPASRQFAVMTKSKLSQASSRAAMFATCSVKLVLQQSATLQ
jgi:hypothetical protein